MGAQGLPLPGGSGDPSQHLPEPSDDRRCRTGETPLAVDLPTQQSTCVQQWYWACTRHVGQSLPTHQPARSLPGRLASRLPRSG